MISSIPSAPAAASPSPSPGVPSFPIVSSPHWSGSARIANTFINRGFELADRALNAHPDLYNGGQVGKFLPQRHLVASASRTAQASLDALSAAWNLKPADASRTADRAFLYSAAEQVRASVAALNTFVADLDTAGSSSPSLASWDGLAKGVEALFNARLSLQQLSIAP